MADEGANREAMMADNREKDAVLEDEEHYGEVVSLTDEDGTEVRFDHLLTFRYLGETYIALLPLEEVEGVNDGEVVMLRISKEGAGDYLPIESPVMLEEVFGVFLELFDEMLDEQENAEEEMPEIDA